MNKEGYFIYEGRETDGQPIVTVNGQRLPIPWTTTRYGDNRRFGPRITPLRFLWLCRQHWREEREVTGAFEDYAQDNMASAALPRWADPWHEKIEPGFRIPVEEVAALLMANLLKG